MLNICHHLERPLYEYQVAAMLRLTEELAAGKFVPDLRAIDRAKEIVRNIQDVPAGNWMSFGKLKIGAKFIAMPSAGDDHGHGGYCGEHYIFEKTSRKPHKNAQRVFDGQLSDMPASMQIIPVA